MIELTILQSGNTYEISPEKKSGDYPYTYKITKNGEEFTSGGGASTPEMAMREAKADIENDLTDADRLTAKLIKAGANRAKVIAVIDGFGDAVDWTYYSLDSIIAEVWQSDLNSGDEPENWIINEICRQFNVEEVSE